MKNSIYFRTKRVERLAKKNKQAKYKQRFNQNGPVLVIVGKIQIDLKSYSMKDKLPAVVYCYL